MRLHNIVELVIIVGCLFILIYERKGERPMNKSSNIIHRSLNMLDEDDKETQKTTEKDIRYIEAG